VLRKGNTRRRDESRFVGAQIKTGTRDPVRKKTEQAIKLKESRLEPTGAVPPVETFSLLSRRRFRKAGGFRKSGVVARRFIKPVQYVVKQAQGHRRPAIDRPDCTD
jgi:hypothetical protein